MAALLAGALALGCGEGAPGSGEEAPLADAEARSPVPPAFPEGASRAVVLHLTGFDEEGIRSEPLEPGGPGSYALGDTVWTDAGALAALLARWDSVAAATPTGQAGEAPTWARPGAAPAVRVEPGMAGPAVAEAAGALVLAGDTTDIPARTHGGAVYALAAAVARRYGALFYRHEPPDAGVRQVSGTVWPRPLLCHYGQGADPEAPVFQQAREEGLFAACAPDPSGRVREPGMY